MREYKEWHKEGLIGVVLTGEELDTLVALVRTGINQNDNDLDGLKRKKVSPVIHERIKHMIEPLIDTYENLGHKYFKVLQKLSVAKRECDDLWQK